MDRMVRLRRWEYGQIGSWKMVAGTTTHLHCMGKIPLASNQCTQFALLSDMKKKSVQRALGKKGSKLDNCLALPISLPLSLSFSAVSLSAYRCRRRRMCGKIFHF